MNFGDLPTLPISPQAIEVVRDLFGRREGVVGSISQVETEFLLTVIDNCEANKVLEIGVASGASALFILGLLAQKPDTWLFSCDVLDFYYGDRSKRLGYLALEREFSAVGQFILSPRTIAAQMRQELERHLGQPNGAIDAAFVDGSHRHPWATLDLLMLLPLMKRDAPVVLHDINLPTLTGLAEDYGPSYLFEAWTGPRTVVKAAIPNIGAITLSDWRLAMDAILSALGREWEVRPTEEQAALLHREAERFLSPMELAAFKEAYSAGERKFA